MTAASSLSPDSHSHHVVQVSLALTGRIDFDGEGARVSGEAIAIAPDSPHAFEGTGLVAQLFRERIPNARRRDGSNPIPAVAFLQLVYRGLLTAP